MVGFITPPLCLYSNEQVGMLLGQLDDAFYASFQVELRGAASLNDDVNSAPTPS